MKKIVVDTNCLIDNPDILLDETKQFAISYVTLQEIDKLKGNPELSYPARQAIKTIFGLFKENKIEILNVPKEGATNDEKIVQDTKDINAQLMSQDIGALVVAQSKGVDIVDLQQVDKEWDKSFKGYEEITLEDKIYYKLTQNEYQHIEIEQHLGGLDIPINSYLILYPSIVGGNYLCFRKFKDKYKLIPQSTKNLKSAGIGLEWLHPEQLIAFDCVFNSESKLAVITGKVGASKTLMSMCGALSRVCGHKNKQLYDRILITRPNIPINKQFSLGYMKGDLEEKMSGWLAPIKTNLQFLFENTEKDRENKEAEKIYEQYFQAMPIESIQGASYHNKILLVDECYSYDTEILTEKGWQRFDSLDKDLKVMQYNSEDRSTSFIKPIRYIEKEYEGELVHLRSEDNFDFLVTPNHELLIKNGRNFTKVEADKLKINSSRKIAVSGDIHKSIGIDDLSPLERLAIALQADGSIGRIKTRGGVSLQFSFSKERKIERFLDLMELGKFKYTENKPSPKKGNCKEKRRFWVSLDVNLTKNLWDIFTLTDITKLKAKSIIEEMLHWDGYKSQKSSYLYTSCVKSQADFYQAVSHIAGYKTKMSKVIDTRSDNFSDVYRLFINLSKNTVGISGMIKSYVPYNDKVYCVTVPDGNIVVRRNGKVAIAGNCQLLDVNTLKQIMSRVAEGSKLILILDPNQTYGANRGVEGYKKLLPHCKGSEYISFIELQHIQRSELTKLVNDIFK